MAFVINPRVSLMTKTVDIMLKGLQRNTKVTLYSYTTVESGDAFYNIAHYLSGPKGEIDLTKDKSFGGFYVGCESMGFLWSMKPHPHNKKPHARFAIENAETPLVIKIKAYEEFCRSVLDINKANCLAEGEVTRVYMAPGVNRISIDTHLKGTLFIPKGKGPFPAVVTAFGAIPRLIETRAALLASRGIMSLALLYYGQRGLPESFEAIDMDYFEEAVKYLQHHPLSADVGILGSSLGGQISALAGCKLGGIKSVVIINSPNNAGICNYMHKNWFVGKVTEDTWKPFIATMPLEKDGENIFPVHKRKDVNYMFQCSGDDQIMPATVFAFQNKMLFDSVGHEKYKICIHPNAGHVLDVPYTPHFHTGYAPWVKKYIVFGGTSRDSHIAQIKSWEEIITFLLRTLSQNKSKL